MLKKIWARFKIRLASNSRDAINTVKRREFSSRTSLESQMRTNVPVVWLSQVSTTYLCDFSHETSPKS